MQQLIYPANRRTSAAQTSQQQDEAEPIFLKPAADHPERATTTRVHSKEKEESGATAYKSDRSDLYGDELEKLLDTRKTKEALRRSREELRQISRQLLITQEKERQRIAADLHDGIGQSLSLIKLSLELAMRQVRAGESSVAVELMQMLTLKIKETMAELHRTTMDLHPPMLDDLGIIPTLSWFFREFEAAWHGQKIEKHIGIDECDVSVPLKATVFRILQEAMNNVVKHAGADRIRVSLQRNDGMLQLSIEDNGRGFDVAGASVGHDARRGFGLFTMKERARCTGGAFDMQSTPGAGTRISVSWRIADVKDDAASFRAHNLRRTHDRRADAQVRK